MQGAGKPARDTTRACSCKVSFNSRESTWTHAGRQTHRDENTSQARMSLYKSNYRSTFIWDKVLLCHADWSQYLIQGWDLRALSPRQTNALTAWKKCLLKYSPYFKCLVHTDDDGVTVKKTSWQLMRNKQTWGFYKGKCFPQHVS